MLLEVGVWRGAGVSNLGVGLGIGVHGCWWRCGRGRQGSFVVGEKLSKGAVDLLCPGGKKRVGYWIGGWLCAGRRLGW